MAEDDELVVGDDQSNDQTASFLQQLGDPRIKVHVNQTRLHHTRNFEACMARATGDILVFSDQDDFWAPEKLAWTRGVFEEYPTVRSRITVCCWWMGRKPWPQLSPAASEPPEWRLVRRAAGDQRRVIWLRECYAIFGAAFLAAFPALGLRA